MQLTPPENGETAPRRVPVGALIVDDLDARAVVDRISDLAERNAGSRLVSAYALHVAGLNCMDDAEFVAAVKRADVVYADGASVVLLARLAGATVIERAPTTDIGWSVLREVGARLDRATTIALVGGAEGLARRAGQVLEQGGAGSVVFCEHGYHQDWATVLNGLNDVRPDVVLVGLGAPKEMKWVEDHRQLLPPSLVLTCGGWFGHLTGDEARAPIALQRSGLEWIARVAQDPRRLGLRYVRGAWSTARLAGPLLIRRRRT